MGNKDLMKLYEKCDRITINKDSKIVILSDVHRGDGTYSDSFLSNRNIYFAALSFYYKKGYTLIEDGDGDELWKNKSYIDIAYNYRGIFKLLNLFNIEKRLHIIYGNHDEKKSNKEYVNREIKKMKNIDYDFGKEFISLVNDMEFKEGIVLKYMPDNKNIFITHGHQVDIMNYNFCSVSKFLVRYFWKFMEGIAGFKAPTSPANNYNKGSKIDEKLNEWASKNKKMLICGHTHKSRFPKPGKGTYFNDGCCVLPYSISCIEICNGSIRLVKWATYVREDTSLYIDRSMIGGPEKIEDYLRCTRN